MKIAKVGSNSKNVWGILVTISQKNLDDLQGFAAAVYIENPLLLNQHRSQLLSGAKTVAEIAALYSGSPALDALHDELLGYENSMNIKWADASDSTTAKYYIGNLAVTTAEHSRITAWVTSRNPEPIWIRCIWEGEIGDDYTYNSCSSGLESIIPYTSGQILDPSITMADIFNQCGYVAWSSGGPVD